MVKVSFIVPTFRAGGFDVLFGGLKGQTMQDYELLLCDDLHDWRQREVKEYAEKLGVNLVHIKPLKSDKPFACGHAVNWGLRYAEGDYVMIGTDYYWLEPDCFERHLKIQKPEGRVSVGLMHHYVAPPLGNLEGKLTVFDHLHEERPEVLELSDRRWSNLVPAPDLGDDYAKFAFHFYLTNYSVLPNATIPLHALIALNGYNECLDLSHGFNDDDLMFRLVNFLNYEVILDKKNVTYHITHPWSRKTQAPEQAMIYYRGLNAILQGFAGIKSPNGFDLIQERCRVRYERWVRESSGVEKPPLLATYMQPPQQRRLQWIEDQCRGAESVLELGCSAGYVLLKAGKNAERLAGMDINRKVIEENKKAFWEVEWVCGDVTKLPLPFPDNSYEVVLATEIFEHIPWANVSPLIMDALRVASKKVLITIPNATLLNYNRRYVESEHHQWALTQDRLYALTLTFLPGLWMPRPSFGIKVNYMLDQDFAYFSLEKLKAEEGEDEVFKRAVMLKEMKEKEAQELMQR